MSLVYWLSKFSHEAMLIELLLIGIVATSYFGYLLLQKRRYGVAKKQIPDNVVRAFLMELISYSEGFKSQLFGDEFKIEPSGKGLSLTVTAAPGAPATAGGDMAGLEALKAAHGAAIAKQDELKKIIASLAKDKAALEAKLAAGGAPAAGAAGGGADPKALSDALDKISKLESKLAEYEVIEDDLANLKKYQQENKQLRAQLEGGQKGGPAPTPAAANPAPAEAPATKAPVEAAAPETAEAPAVPEPAVAAPAAAEALESPVAAAEESAAATEAAAGFEGLVDKVEESLATPAPTPAGASAVDPKAAAQAQTAPPVVEKPAAPAAAAPAPAAPTSAEKSDADLLNEFERMLSS